MPLSRRELLAAAPLWMAGCAVRHAGVISPAIPALARVRVAPERVIRTIAGLRPFRPSGFVVRVEKLDGKTVIHNYGHGGAGITLSWGTAKLALDFAAAAETRQAAVIGCGVVGLSTARLLQERGYTVTIYAKAMPPDTTSNVAGGLWSPVTVFDHESITPEFRSQFANAAGYAFRRYQSMVGDAYGVRWLPVYMLSTDSPHQAPAPESAYAAIESLFPDSRQLKRNEHGFDAAFVYRRYSMLIEPAIYLPALLRDFLAYRGNLVVRDFRDLAELQTLPESLLFNCTGLGARDLFHDEQLIPIRGQLSFLLPQPDIDYMTIGPGDIYMFPRRDGILLGGTHDRGVWDLQPDQAATDRILRENAAVFNSMRTGRRDS